MTYKPPVNEMAFILKNAAKVDDILSMPAFSDFDSDIIMPVLDEAAKLASNVWGELNVTGDRQGATIADKKVTTTPGFKDAYMQYVYGGWNALPHNPEFGGQGLPWVLSMATNEMWQGANLSLGLCPLLTQAGIEALEHHGSETLQQKYLEKLISGEWAGTMCLTEPQAGTDLAAIRTIARKDGDHYKLTGQKIYITYGDHEFTENIIHMVLAKMDGLPDDNTGLGLFLLPKFLEDGTRNDVYPVSLEHKLGIHGSPTCVMAYGDNDGAVGYLVGNAGEGLKNMFTMMNNARISVGLQGVALMERATQHAVQYARERIQSFKLGGSSDERVMIIEHADVQRMLLTMKAYTTAGRALSYYAGAQLDKAAKSDDGDIKKAASKRADFLTPLVKAWCTDRAVEVASMGIQVHGGMGFIEETGAAQYYRDARILPIYEGTNGIQAADFVFRKVMRDQGAEAKAYLAEMEKQDISKLPTATQDALKTALKYLGDSLTYLSGVGADDPDQLAASSTLILQQYAAVAAGFRLAECLTAAESDSARAKTYRYFIETLMPLNNSLTASIKSAHAALFDMAVDEF